MCILKKEALEKIYGESVESGERFYRLGRKFREKYNRNQAEFFSAPGRTEIIGNHTDHNGGLVIAGSIHMDTIGAACPNGSTKIHITSEGYGKEIKIDLADIERGARDLKGTEALIAGMMEGVLKAGFKVSGFDAYVATEVIGAAGVSSSASFEMLVCAMVDYFFNDGAMSYVHYAKAGQYAENHYWNKASGLMDQMACAVGGTILMDFSEPSQPTYQKLDFTFHDIGYQLVIVNTGKGHADLSAEYSEIPQEMFTAANAIGVERLCETSRNSLMEKIPEIGNDRAVLRALHFFQENDRVKRAAEAIAEGDADRLLRLIQESGTSSWEWLQNCYAIGNAEEQKVPLTLALTELFLERSGKGACRVHGGGFAGVIMCLLPEQEAEDYVSYISKFVGKENVYPLSIRSAGAVRITV
ncbi:galactokinase [Blautia schinkii]|nr:galactokinase [Blautia schinkii]